MLAALADDPDTIVLDFPLEAPLVSDLAQLRVALDAAAVSPIEVIASQRDYPGVDLLRFAQTVADAHGLVVDAAVGSRLQEIRIETKGGRRVATFGPEAAP